MSRTGTNLLKMLNKSQVPKRKTFVVYITAFLIFQTTENDSFQLRSFLIIASNCIEIWSNFEKKTDYFYSLQIYLKVFS